MTESATSTGSTALSSAVESWDAAGAKAVPRTVKNLIGMPAGARTVAMALPA